MVMTWQRLAPPSGGPSGGAATTRPLLTTALGLLETRLGGWVRLKDGGRREAQALLLEDKPCV